MMRPPRRPPLPRRKVLALVLSVLLFVGSVALALLLATPAPQQPSVRHRPGPRQEAQYRLDDRGALRLQGEVAPGRQGEVEILPTDQGLLIRPAP